MHIPEIKSDADAIHFVRKLRRAIKSDELTENEAKSVFYAIKTEKEKNPYLKNLWLKLFQLRYIAKMKQFKSNTGLRYTGHHAEFDLSDGTYFRPELSGVKIENYTHKAAVFIDAVLNVPNEKIHQVLESLHKKDLFPWIVLRRYDILDNRFRERVEDLMKLGIPVSILPSGKDFDSGLNDVEVFLSQFECIIPVYNETAFLKHINLELPPIYDNIEDVPAVNLHYEDHLVSVVIAAYGQEQYIVETLKSLQNQTFHNWEAIVVDDGSPDNVMIKAEEIARTDSRISLVRSANAGVSAARNLGASKAKGDFLLFLDGDDIIAPSYLRTTLSAMLGNPTLKGAFSWQKKFGAIQQEIPIFPFEYNMMLFNNPVYLSVLIRKSDFDKSSGFNSHMSLGLEDWEWWIRFLEPGPSAKYPEVHIIPEYLFFYRQKSVSRNNTILTDRKKEMNSQENIISLNSSIYKRRIPFSVFPWMLGSTPYHPWLKTLIDAGNEPNNHIRKKQLSRLKKITITNNDISGQLKEFILRQITKY